MKYKIEDIQQLASEHNWTLVSDTYQNLDSELIFQCAEGHTVYTTWRKVRDKWECPICNKNKYKTFNHKSIKKEKGVVRILALDQSSKLTGYSVFDNQELVDYGVFESSGFDEIARGHNLKE